MSEAPPRPLRIIMIDDDREDAFLVRRAFKKLNSSVSFDHILDSATFVATLGDDAQSNKTQADVILLDINMPRVNGFEVLKTLRATRQFDGAKVIMLTTSESDEDRSEAMRLGADDFMSKPSTTDGLKTFVQGLLPAS